MALKPSGKLAFAPTVRLAIREEEQSRSEWIAASDNGGIPS
jgi:hypothetical protein